MYAVNHKIDDYARFGYRVNMTTVNAHIRQAVRIELARRDSTQAQLAEKVGVSRQYINNVMRARAGNVPAVWQRVFDELDLELVVRAKERRASD